MMKRTMAMAVRVMPVCILLTLAVGLGGCRREIVISPTPARQEAEPQTADTGDDLPASAGQEPETDAPEAAQTDREEATEAFIYVHVTGAVRRPGVICLHAGDRVFQAVEAAGGFTDQADQDWCNQAMPLADADKLQIYTLEETASFAQQGISARAEGYGLSGAAPAGADRSGQWEAQGAADEAGESAAGTDLLNLNTASREELMTLPGIGERRAEDIIAYRDRTGGFSCVEELTNISGIGNAILGKLADRVTV